MERRDYFADGLEGAEDCSEVLHVRCRPASVFLCLPDQAHGVAQAEGQVGDDRLLL